MAISLITAFNHDCNNCRSHGSLEVLAMLKAIHAQEDRPTELAQAADVVVKLRAMKLSKASMRASARRCATWHIRSGYKMISANCGKALASSLSVRSRMIS